MRVLQISDTHLSAASPEPRASWAQWNWEHMAALIGAERPDLVVHTGDIVLADPDATADHLHARAAMRRVGVPIRFVPGNHDVGDHVVRAGLPPEWRSKPVTAARCAHYRGIWGPDHWALERGGWLLVGLNSMIIGSGLDGESDQLRWLTETLAAWDGDVAVFTHEPLRLRDVARSAESWALPPQSARESLLARLTRSRVRVLASGHVHRYTRFDSGPRCFVTAPSTAYAIPPRAGMRHPPGDAAVGFVEYTFTSGFTVRPRRLLTDIGAGPSELPSALA